MPLIGRIIAFIACFMCAIPFMIIAKFNKDGREPINFWSGDYSLKEKVKDVTHYNLEMAKLYRQCAWIFVITGVIFFVSTMAGVVCIGIECTVGIYVAWRRYKTILEKYS